MQPVFTQVPPNWPRSMKATVSPAAVSRLASEGPACPAPMMIVSNCRAIAALPFFTGEYASRGDRRRASIDDCFPGYRATEKTVDGRRPVDDDTIAEPVQSVAIARHGR